MKKLITLIILSILIYSNSMNMVYAKETPPSVSADSVVLMDALTGEVLYSKNPDSAYPPASTTKIMTALLTLEKTNLDDKVKIGKNPPLADGSKIYLYEGEELTVRDLLYGLLLASANDCAEALAEHISGSLDKFSTEMNKRALELGAKNTNFINPSGLFNEKHKTSAKDLALIMRELCKNPEYSKIATTVSYKIPPTNKSAQERPLWNENKLIQKQSKLYYDGCKGGKTGYTVQSLHSYVSTATRNGQQLIVTLIHDKDKTFFPDAIALFNYGFNNFQLNRLYAKGDVVTTYNKGELSVPLIAASDFYYVKEKDNKSIPTFNLASENLSSNFFKAGDPVMEANILLDNKNIGKLNLLSGSNHELKQMFNSNTLGNTHIKIKYLAPVAVLSIIILIFILKRCNIFRR